MACTLPVQTIMTRLSRAFSTEGQYPEIVPVGELGVVSER
jgi:hypothetical protein